MEQETVNYKIVSSEGHTDREDVLVNDAVTEIKDLVESESKWLYVDKEHIADINNITADLLLQASNIMLTNTQAGGQ